MMRDPSPSEWTENQLYRFTSECIADRLDQIADTYAAQGEWTFTGTTVASELREAAKIRRAAGARGAA